MHEEVDRLGELISNLHALSLTDVGALAYRFEPIELTEVLRTTVRSMQGRFDAADLRLLAHIDESPLVVFADMSRLRQLFSNLLENALRYTDAGGLVRVHCAGKDDTILLMFEDSAPGVPDDKLGFLFERFYRVEASRNRASGGSGLGLAICRNIVEAHAG